MLEENVRYTQCVNTDLLQQEPSVINYVSIMHYHVGQSHHTERRFQRAL